MGRKITIIVLVALVVGIVTSLQSLPRLAVEQGLACKQCHVNPGGGGMRTEFGNYSVALNELCLPQTKKHFLKKYRSPRIADGVTIGFDARYLVFDNGDIFRMQTDAYLALEPFKDIFYQFRFREDGISENYALLYIDNQKYHIKAGRFYPSFGLRNADHTSFNRERTGHRSNVYLDGLALGGDIGSVNLSAELFNSNSQGVYGLHAFKFGYRAPFSYMCGVSIRMSEKVYGSNREFPWAKAVFGGLSYDRFTLLGEVDIVGQSNDTLITYAGLTTRVEYGLYLIAEYNFFDGDRDFSTGVDEYLRLSAEVFPVPFVELRPSLTHYLRGAREGEDDFFFQFHLGY